MTRELEQVLLPELGREEPLLWSGRPRQGVRLRLTDAYSIPFSLIWGGSVIYIEVTAWTRSNQWLLRLWGIPLVMVGLYIMVGRFFHESFLRAHTFYGVTGQRAIIVSGARKRVVRSIELRRLDLVSLDEREDKSGTITFGPPNPPPWAHGRGSRRLPESPMFEMVERVRDVYDLIRQAKSGD
jgi:hypothetical protein